jgi:hypothetical protein
LHDLRGTAVSNVMQGVAVERLGFAADSEVEVRQDGATDWVTLRPLVYRGKFEVFEVDEGVRADFASVPRPFVWFLPRYGRYTKAAILHDYLCKEKVATGLLSRADADGIFRQAMRTLDVPFLRRWIMWAAVRVGALSSAAGRTGWLSRSWAVLPVAIVAVPIVLPAALIIVVTLPVFYLAELIAWVALLIGRRAHPGMRQEPVKRVNKPSLRIKL